MPVLEIVTYGNPVLARKAEPVAAIDEEILKLAQSMVLTMHAAPGIGLAAPQVNIGKRLITVDLSVGEDPGSLIVLVNAELLESQGEAVEEEGCLSVPGIRERVKRPERVRVRGIDLEGRERTIKASGLLARVFCHEVDHINGKLFIEHLSPLKKTLVKKRLKREKESG